MFDCMVLLDVIVSFPPTSGRMRYAPTPIRLKSWGGGVGSRTGFTYAHFRAYAIRPYTCLVEILGLLGEKQNRIHCMTAVMRNKS